MERQLFGALPPNGHWSQCHSTLIHGGQTSRWAVTSPDWGLSDARGLARAYALQGWWDSCRNTEGVGMGVHQQTLGPHRTMSDHAGSGRPTTGLA